MYVPRGVALTEPISLRTRPGRARGTLLNQRTLVVLEEGAQAEVWEQYLSASAELDGVFNAVTELVVGDGARLRYVCGQGLSETQLDLRRPARRGRPRRGRSTGWRSGSARRAAACGWRRGWAARAPRRA